MTYEQLLELLQDFLIQVEEDCPSEYRSKHLRMCMRDVREVLGIA